MKKWNCECRSPVHHNDDLGCPDGDMSAPQFRTPVSQASCLKASLRGTQRLWELCVVLSVMIASSSCASEEPTSRAAAGPSHEYCNVARDLYDTVTEEVSEPLSRNDGAIQPVLAGFFERHASDVEAVRSAAPEEIASSVNEVWHNLETVAQSGDITVLDRPAAQNASTQVLSFDSEVCGIVTQGE